MKIVEDVKEMQKLSKDLKRDKTIGFVPTMGFLHEGHLSLARKAKEQNDIVVMSVFVNPLQFAEGEDFDTYPRDRKRDEELAEKAGVDILFFPSEEDMYPEDFQTHVNVEKLTQVLEGASRPLFFKGVTTVVCKLFNIVKPDRAYFGRKDAQQLIVVKKMVEDLNMDVEIVPMPIVREQDGLATSSRNRYLNEEERKSAVCLYKALKKARQMVEKGTLDTKTIIQNMEKIISSYPFTRIDYISINRTDDLKPLKHIETGKTLISLAVFVGKTRLIDNIWM
ncbi:MAG: pantoate--beta-alanine ligase [Deltaproteobacteria bacterium]|nr:pantoate--beta-alanine ligase [Deltaproteobacteria bacterium]